MAACAEHDLSGEEARPSSTITVIEPGKKGPSRMRRIASSCVFWIGMAVIGVLVIPAGILFGMIHLIIGAISFIMNKIEKD